jgi:putative iron-dependent peroxidase
LATIEVQEEVHGFRWIEERDLSGFVDGTKTRRVKRRVVKWRSSKMAWMRRQLCVRSALGA